jgi:hypothetical protein
MAKTDAEERRHYRRKSRKTSNNERDAENQGKIINENGNQKGSTKETQEETEETNMAVHEYHRSSVISHQHRSEKHFKESGVVSSYIRHYDDVRD